MEQHLCEGCWWDSIKTALHSSDHLCSGKISKVN